MMEYRKGILVSGLLAIAFGVAFSIISTIYGPVEPPRLTAITALALAANIVSLLIAYRLRPSLFPTKGDLAEALVAQLLLFIVAWSSIYNILK